MSTIKIISANCQGLHDSKKRKDIFQYYRQLDCNILCLQDTHFTNDMEDNIRNEWGYDAVFSSFTSQSRGVAILLNNNFDFKIHKKVTDDSGNFIALDINIGDQRVCLISVYGPNDDTPLFYDELSKVVMDIGINDIIIVGDFNLVMNAEIDYYNYLHLNNPKARDKVLEMITQFNLTDIYREFHPNKKRYTWRKPTPLKQARLDFFLVSNTLLNMVQESEILASYKSDHSPVLLNLKLNEFTHGKGLWKFNNSLLYDNDFLKTINQKIHEIKQRYALPVYNIDSIDKIPDNEIQFIVNDQLFLETLLMEIRGKCISYSSYIKKKSTEKEQSLLSQINQLEEKYEENIETINLKKKELENIRNHKLMGNIVRSKAKWISEGEKPTNYFLNLENRHFTNKIVPKLLKEDSTDEITSQNNILLEIENYYKNLYQSRNDLCDFNLDEILPISNNKLNEKVPWRL